MIKRCLVILLGLCLLGGLVSTFVSGCVKTEPNPNEKLEKLIYDECLALMRAEGFEMTDERIKEFDVKWEEIFKDMMVPQSGAEEIFKTMENPSQEEIDTLKKQIKRKLEIMHSLDVSLPVIIIRVVDKIKKGETVTYIELFMADRLADVLIAKTKEDLKNSKK